MTHGINLDYRKTFWDVNVLRLIHRDHPQRIQSDDLQRNREAVPEAGKTLHTSEDRLNHGTIPMPRICDKAVEWGRDASSHEHLVGTKHGLLKCRSVRRKPLENKGVDVTRSKLEGRNGILT